jgi:hypothetical protein
MWVNAHFRNYQIVVCLAEVFHVETVASAAPPCDPKGVCAQRCSTSSSQTHRAPLARSTNPAKLGCLVSLHHLFSLS